MLKEQGITHILNVTRNIPFHLEATHAGDYVFKRISVNDALDQNLRQFFEEAYEFIGKRALSQKYFFHIKAFIKLCLDFIFKRTCTREKSESASALSSGYFSFADYRNRLLDEKEQYNNE